MEESALHRPVGSNEILRRQLHHLRAAAADKSWTIRVVPAGKTITSGPFTLLRQPDRSPVVLLEHLTCRLFLERPHDIETYENALKHLNIRVLDECPFTVEHERWLVDLWWSGLSVILWAR